MDNLCWLAVEKMEETNRVWCEPTFTTFTALALPDTVDTVDTVHITATGLKVYNMLCAAAKVENF